MQIIKIAAAAALLAGAATLAFAQTPPPASPQEPASKAQPGAPDQSPPAKQAPATGSGSLPIGPPAAAAPAPAPNPTGVSKEKQKSDQNDPQIRRHEEVSELVRLERTPWRQRHGVLLALRARRDGGDGDRRHLNTLRRSEAALCRVSGARNVGP